MIKFTALYPNNDGAVFDFDYYKSKHLPLTLSLLGGSVLRSELDKGVSGANGAPALYIAAGHLYFESVDALRATFFPHLRRLREDIPNFTNVEPLIQVSEIIP